MVHRVRVRSMCAVLALVAALTACSGPSLPLRVVGKGVPVNVSFGTPTGALPVVGVRPDGDGFVVLPAPLEPDPLPPFRVPDDPPPLGRCPKASPFAFPKREATNAVGEQPAAASYVYRLTGERRIGGAVHRYPATATRTVGNIARTDASMRYDVSEVAGTEGTITSFQVTAERLALTGVQRIAGGRTDAFQPVTPLTILPLPPRQTDAFGAPVTEWRSAAVDAARATTVSVEGRVLGRERVDACGALVDTWLAELRIRTIAPTRDVEGIWRINVATQYGALLVAESLVATGTENRAPYEERRTARIAEEPRS